VLLSVFQAFLFRYTWHETVVVGSPVVNRGQSKLEAMIGFFVNMLVFRADFSNSMTFRELLRQGRETALEAYAHQELPFEKLIEELQPERDPSVNPIFQVMFTLQNVGRGGDDTASQPAISTQSAKFDLSMDIADDGRALRGAFNYKTALFDSATIERMAGHFVSLLSRIAEDIDQPLTGIPLLSEVEQEAMRAWNQTSATYAPGACLHELFAAQAARTPDAVAAMLGDEEMTYAELERCSRRVALHLRGLGVQTENLVGICIERSLDLITAIVGVLMAGGAYVPLDPEQPDERLHRIIKDAGLSVILASSSAMDRLASTGVRLVRVQDCLQGSEAFPDSPSAVVGPNNAAYVIYTSGSTGAPKGAINTHEAVVNRLLWMQDVYNLTTADRVLQKTSIGFDVSVWELLWPILTGAGLVFAAPGQQRDAVYLTRAISRHGITHMHFVPSMLQAFLDEAGSATFPSLRRVICSGEELTVALQDAFFRRMGDCELYNLYGPTEAAIDVTWWRCRTDPARHSVPIGHAIANTRMYILDRCLNQVPVGVTGEIYIGGIAPARGYLRRPELTAERFVPDPIEPKPGARMYRTGDLGRRLPGGEIEYLGRIDHQVKLRGVRIELGEIGAMLLEHPDVREAMVIMDSDAGSGDKRLIAYYIRKSEQPLDGQELYRWLEQKLPLYMVPALYVELDAFPLSQNGKLDRRALPRPRPARADKNDTIAPLKNPLEALIAAIWVEVLRVDRVGAEDNFFQLGGHSLLAIRVLSRLRDTVGAEMSVSRFFNVPTPTLLAAELLRIAPDPEELMTRSAALMRVSSLSDEEVADMLRAAAAGDRGASKESEPSE
jgi:amino acid adenylation domain-containing protein